MAFVSAACLLMWARTFFLLGKSVIVLTLSFKLAAAMAMSSTACRELKTHCAV